VSDEERLGATRMIIALENNLPGDLDNPRHDVYRALQAVGWSLYKNARHALRDGMCWMPDEVQHRIRDGGLAARLTAAQ